MRIKLEPLSAVLAVSEILTAEKLPSKFNSIQIVLFQKGISIQLQIKDMKLTAYFALDNNKYINQRL